MDALNVDISNTTEPIHTGFVASERKFSWAHFSVTILGAGKYHQNIKMYTKCTAVQNGDLVSLVVCGFGSSRSI
jgi:hypothetical protein